MFTIACVPIAAMIFIDLKKRMNVVLAAFLALVFAWLAGFVVLFALESMGLVTDKAYQLRAMAQMVIWSVVGVCMGGFLKRGHMFVAGSVCLGVAGLSIITSVIQRAAVTSAATPYASAAPAPVKFDAPAANQPATQSPTGDSLETVRVTLDRSRPGWREVVASDGFNRWIAGLDGQGQAEYRQAVSAESFAVFLDAYQAHAQQAASPAQPAR